MATEACGGARRMFPPEAGKRGKLPFTVGHVTGPYRKAYPYEFRPPDDSPRPLLLLATTSCLPLPLSDSQHSQVEARLAGLWTSAGQNGKEMGVVIVPFDAHAYMIQFAVYAKAGDQYQSESMMMMKAWLADVKGSRFIVCQPAACLAGAEPADPSIYLTYRIKLEGDVLKAQRVNADYPKFKDLRDAAALAKVVEENLDDPGMYGCSRANACESR